MKDIHSDMTVVSAIGAAVLAADNTPAAIDLQGYNAAEVVLSVGIGGITFTTTNKIEFKLTHSADDSTYDDVTTEDRKSTRLNYRHECASRMPPSARKKQTHHQPAAK